MENRLFFPIFLDLTGKRILVVGAGRIATRRIRTLLPFGAALTVVASEPSDEISSIYRRAPCRSPFSSREFNTME